MIHDSSPSEHLLRELQMEDRRFTAQDAMEEN